VDPPVNGGNRNGTEEYNMSRTSALREMVKSMESQIHTEEQPQKAKAQTVELRLGTIEIPLEIAPGIAYAMANERTKTEKAFVKKLVIRAAKRHLKKVAELGLEVPQMETQMEDAGGDEQEGGTTAASEPKKEQSAPHKEPTTEPAMEPKKEDGIPPREESARETVEPPAERPAAPPERKAEEPRRAAEEKPHEGHSEAQKKRSLFSLT